MHIQNCTFPQKDASPLWRSYIKLISFQTLLNEQSASWNSAYPCRAGILRPGTGYVHLRRLRKGYTVLLARLVAHREYMYSISQQPFFCYQTADVAGLGWNN